MSLAGADAAEAVATSLADVHAGGTATTVPLACVDAAIVTVEPHTIRRGMKHSFVRGGFIWTGNI